MQTIGIIGSNGFLGWHLRCLLSVQEGIEILCCTKDNFSSDSFLRTFVKQCDAIVHLGGVNRGTDEELLENVFIAERLVEALKNEDVTPHVLYSSSTHIARETVYGKAKRLAGDLIDNWANRSSGNFTNVIFPNLYGECGKPFYNSVVATFCHQIAAGDKPRIEQDAELEILHASDASRYLFNAIQNKDYGVRKPEGHVITVSELLETIITLDSSYKLGVVPELHCPFIQKLFNTYRSYWYPTKYPVFVQEHSDNRGSLFEGVKTKHGGQAFLSSTKPSITRGNHFHFAKFERFLVVQGNAIIRLRKLFSDEVIEFTVSGDAHCYIDIPTLHTHNITNVGNSELLTFFWSNEIFDPENPDTYPDTVTDEGAST